jgi:hypothetical protein
MAFENLPGHSRIWIYGFEQQLNVEQHDLVKARLERFKDEWMYHGSAVTGDYDIIENRFVIIATDETISGCSIDSSVAVFKELKQNYGLDALNQNLIFYRDRENIVATDRTEFQKLVNNGKVDENTHVFNLMINQLVAHKNGFFETEFNNSWHGKVFKLPQEIIS